MEIRTELLIDGAWIPGLGPPLVSTSPSHDDRVVWHGAQASPAQVVAAVAAARAAQPAWFRRPLGERIKVCRDFAAFVKARAAELAEWISLETGKARWDAKGEAATVVGKIELSIDALRERRDMSSFEMGNALAVTRFKPHGVLGVLGPFNFPAHLPNGHVVPALLAGNAVVFKPSEQAPGVGAWMADAWQQVGLPPGVLNLIHGERDVGEALIADPQLDGLLFTGSSRGGRALHRTWAEHPEKILALEMGGNNPLIVGDVERLDAAVYHTILSAYVSAGQRCTCARRLIVVDGPAAGPFIEMLIARIQAIHVGYYFDDPPPFYGALIHRRAGEAVLRASAERVAQGARVLVPHGMLQENPALISPGLIDATGVAGIPDEEVFGPLLTLYRVKSLDEAIRLANETRYGLSAGLLSDRRDDFEQFVAEIRAGIVNWNRATTGASGRLPFGGAGLSGNHRPAGYFAADYCAYPVASLEVENLAVPGELEPGLHW